MTNLREQYTKKAIPALRERFGYPNVMAVPKIDKVIVNVGVGRVAKDDKMISRINEDISKITGQKPSVRKAKKSISGFKLRQGMDVGFIVTLRGKRMYDFIERLTRVALPRSRDFKGILLSNVDQSGNLNLGIREQNIFPEISYESMKDIFGFQITVTTTAKSKEEGIALLRLIGFPLQSSENH